MSLKVDYNFTYNNTLRFMLIQKFGFFSNVMEIPVVQSLIIFFNIRDLEDLDDTCIYNYFYLVRFFFGKKCYFKKYSYFFNLGRYFYSFTVQTCFNVREVYFPIFFFVNDLLMFTSKSNFKVLHQFTLNKNIFIIPFFDMNLFLEKKTNLGLYNLKNYINFKFFIKGGDFLTSTFLMDSLKLNF